MTPDRRSYKNPDRLWLEEFQGYLQYHFVWQKNTTGDGFALNNIFTNSTVRVITDAWRVASGALIAQNQMRDFGIEDARKLAGHGFEVAVTGEDRGFWQNLTNGMHIVLEIDGAIIQPKDESDRMGAAMSDWSGTAKHSAASARFAFDLPDNHEPMARIIFIAGNGKRHYLPIDFRRLR